MKHPYINPLFSALEDVGELNTERSPVFITPHNQRVKSTINRILSINSLTNITKFDHQQLQSLDSHSQFTQSFSAKNMSYNTSQVTNIIFTTPPPWVYSVTLHPHNSNVIM